MSVLLRRFCTSAPKRADYSHVVIGAGVVGLSIASQLTKIPGSSVLVVEKNADIGQETSSRNSEVVHAGLYYPENSLKMQMCLAGKRQIYELAAKSRIRVSQVGKWIVAQNDSEDAYLEEIHQRSKSWGVPTEFVPLPKAKYIEPGIVAKSSILNSPTSGIIDAHSLLNYLNGEYQEGGGELALNSTVVSLAKSGANYEILVQDTGNLDEKTKISTEVVINCAGLYSDKISNMLLPEDRHVNYIYAKGNYFTLQSQLIPVRRLVYPTPMKNLKGLGTHLTIAMDGQIKFGPDREITDSPSDYIPNAANIPKAFEQIIKYYPGIQLQDLVATYSGIRPQLAGVEKAFQDFVIREEDGFPGFINLLNIDSPGLTSSLAIGEYVAQMCK